MINEEELQKIQFVGISDETADDGELSQDSVVKESLTTALDGKNYKTFFYNLDAILTLGYRVKSPQSTQFCCNLSITRHFFLFYKPKLKNYNFNVSHIIDKKRTSSWIFDFS